MENAKICLRVVLLSIRRSSRVCNAPAIRNSHLTTRVFKGKTCASCRMKDEVIKACNQHVTELFD